MDAGGLMKEKGIGHLAVTEDDKIIGVLRIADALAHQLRFARGEQS
ncbi:MAG: hypothetical protein QGG38_07535 [Nitrospinaceae bacterium]|jgi:signal-transduction protein with cAMP-binding, CBS, and nucleotidyltransferase domain|nr:hypothetical protein [Nitrospinaceae bacterium]|tara:strand:- start:2429 stop:2566 length:138 start_codon:yes stop_codon:yes gene_type:complete